MLRFIMAGLLVALLAACGGKTEPEKPQRQKIELPPVYPALQTYLDARLSEADQIDSSRMEALQQLVDFGLESFDKYNEALYLYVCTHNSRRSQLAHAFTFAYAHYFDLKVAGFSGGTEVTAFHENARAALNRAGFEVELVKVDNPETPENALFRTATGYDSTRGSYVAIQQFSKPMKGAPNPGSGFCAVMVCSDADEACPFVEGAAKRVSLPFVDPKVSDGTPEMEATYDARAAQIARELGWVFSQLKAKLDEKQAAEANENTTEGA